MKKTNILELNFDLMIVLDSCRYDYFEKYNTIKGKLEKIKSVGTSTYSFIKNSKLKRYDFNIVTNNPWFTRFQMRKMNYSLGNNIITYVDTDELNECYSTMRIKYQNDYFIEKYILWICKPHIINAGKRKQYTQRLKEVIPQVQHIINDIRHLPIKILVTSDHGELFGEYGKTGHPDNYFVPELYEIPLLYVDNK